MNQARPKSPTDDFMGSLGHQDWSKVVLRNKTTVNASHAAQTKKPAAASQAIASKIADADIAGRIKQLAPESLQQVVNIRAANKWTQAELNQRCNFPVNTIREIEAGRLTPTIGQLNTLNRVLKVGLKLV
jgi:ribosome-binding protein aMBF1 (putative translation factor)